MEIAVEGRMRDFAVSVENGPRKLAGDFATWAIGALGFCTVLYALTSLALPFGWDHDIIASVGSSYVRGGLPYVNSWDIKGPAAYLPFALVQIMFGPTMWGIRLFDAIVWAIAGCCLYEGVCRLTTWRLGAGTALATYLWIASSGWFFTAAPESWVTASCVLAIVPMLSPSGSPTLVFVALSGFLIAIAGLIKPFYFAFGLAPLTAILLSSEIHWRRRSNLAAVLAVGAIAPSAAICGYFAIRGGLSAAVQVHILYPLSSYVATTSGWRATVGGVESFLKNPPIIITAPFALLAIWLYRSNIRILVTLLVWLIVALLCVAAQGKYYVYHWFPVYPPMFMLAALGAFTLVRTNVRPSILLVVLALCSVVMLAAVAERPLRDVAKFVYFTVLKHDSNGYYSSYDFRLYNAADEISAARYISAHTNPDQRIFVWGSDAIYYLADRPNASRFTFVMPLMLPGPYRAAYRGEAMRELMEHPPTYFITGISWEGLYKAAADIKDFPAMEKVLDEQYSLEKNIGVLSIYRRRAEPRNARINKRLQRIGAS